MGRRKITIKQITDPKLRHITFNKRKNGLIKKAAELSLLCNVNMLLVFEDDTGNLIQFSKNKIQNVHSFFQECKFNNIVELTAKEYPHFFKVNHYKKGKDHDEKSSEDDDDDDLDVTAQQELYYSSGEQKQEVPKSLMKAPKQKEVHLKKETVQQIPNQNNLYLPSQKMELQALPNMDRNNFANDNTMKQEILANGKNNKLKPNIKPAMGRPEDNGKQTKSSMNDNNLMKAPMPQNETNEPINFRWGPLHNHEDQLRQATEKNNMNNLGNLNNINNLDYTSSSFKASGVDPIKRLNGVTDPTINSPFRFYPNGRLNPNFNNYASAFGSFGGDETLNSMLKNYQFSFPIQADGSFMTKPSNGTDIDEKLLQAKMLGYLNQAGQTPINRPTNLFHFPPSDYTKMNGNPDAMRQAPNRNEQEFHNNYTEETHEENPIFKPDSRFENNLPSANVNSRRIGYDNYYGGYDEEFGGDVKKKFKHN